MGTEQCGKSTGENRSQNFCVLPPALSCDKNGRDPLPTTLSFLFQVERSPVFPKVLGIATISRHQDLRSDPLEQLVCPGDSLPQRDCHHHHMILTSSSTCAGPTWCPGETPRTFLLLTDEPSPPLPDFPSLQEANGPKGLTLEE